MENTGWTLVPIIRDVIFISYKYGIFCILRNG
jgi:hypothetical protein